jgi:zinc D-Ala-D-Ala carboxypeptidase
MEASLMAKPLITTALLSSLFFVTAGCSIDGNFLSNNKESTSVEEHEQIDPVTEKQEQPKSNEKIADQSHDSIPVLINKKNSLPETYAPEDLVYPNIRFIFEEKIEKRMLRKEAAEAIEQLFQAAIKQGLPLAGVSAYRSHETQTALFNHYVETDGLENAILYSAVPGTSEHETGLAIDVTVSDGSCAAEDCFGETEEAKWLEKNAPLYGYIIRYPKGKEEITGYKYEPWHLRYVGKEIAQNIATQNITLEEYYQAVPVAK